MKSIRFVRDVFASGHPVHKAGDVKPLDGNEPHLRRGDAVVVPQEAPRSALPRDLPDGDALEKPVGASSPERPGGAKGRK